MPRALGGVSSTEPVNTVISTNPGQGTEATLGSTVSIQYANGTTRVPDVTGQSVAQATAILQAANFTVTPIVSGTGDGSVDRQSPSGNQTAAQGSNVTIFSTTVASATPSPTPTESSPAPSTSASGAASGVLSPPAVSVAPGSGPPTPDGFSGTRR